MVSRRRRRIKCGECSTVVSLGRRRKSRYTGTVEIIPSFQKDWLDFFSYLVKLVAVAYHDALLFPT